MEILEITIIVNMSWLNQSRCQPRRKGKGYMESKYVVVYLDTGTEFKFQI